MSTPEVAPEVRVVIEKTAAFVALDTSFEGKLREKERANPKFAFLSTSDPLHALFRRRVQELQAAKPSLVTSAPAKTLVPPPRDQFSAPQPKGISAQALEVIKLTAQFVARNGQAFQVGLCNREAKNPLFDFLRPTDMAHPYFASLVEQYRTVLLPPRDIGDALRARYASPYTVLAKLADRVDWEIAQEKARKAAEEEAEAERVATAKINWQDFVVVATIDFDEEEDDEAEAEKKKKEKTEDEVKESTFKVTAKALPVEDVDMDIDDSEENVVVRPAATAAAKKKAGSGMTQLCPKCGLQIPIEEFSEHLRIELLDPRARQQKQLSAERGSTTALAPDDDVIRNLQLFAKKRTDIFGTKEDELAALERAKERERQEKLRALQAEALSWDGHSASAPKIAAIQQQLKQQSQIQQIQEKPATLPAPPPQPPPPPPPSPPQSLPLPLPLPLPVPPPEVFIPQVLLAPLPPQPAKVDISSAPPEPESPPPPPPPPPEEDEPAQKRQRMAREAELIPE
jgi:splicing factor 3A subunit 1